MVEEKTVVIGAFIDPKEISRFDLSSTLRLRARSIDPKKLWASKDRSAEFMGDIWALFVNSRKEERIRTVLHSVCVELIENSVKYGCQDYDYIIVIELCLRNNELLVYVVNKCVPERIAALERSANLVLSVDNIHSLFKQKIKEAKAAKKQGKQQSQLGLIRIAMQDVKLAWQVKIKSNMAVVTTLAKISLNDKED